MAQIATVLFAGWLVGAIAFATLPRGRSIRWKLIAIAALFIAFLSREHFFIGIIFDRSSTSEVKIMETHTVMRVATMMALLCTGMLLPSENVCAQAIDFSQIDKFESMGTATLRGASPPKTIVDDGEWHSVFVTIWQSDTEAKAYWKSLDGNAPQTTIIRGTGVHAFQTAGEFRLEVLGDQSRSVAFGYLLLGLRKRQE